MQPRAVSHELSLLLQEWESCKHVDRSQNVNEELSPDGRGNGVSAQPWETPAPSAFFQVHTSLQPLSLHTSLQDCPSPPTKYLL